MSVNQSAPDRYRDGSSQSKAVGSGESGVGSQELIVSSDKPNVSKRKPSFKEKREFEMLRKEIANLTKEKQDITSKLNSGTTPFEELQELSVRIGDVTAAFGRKGTSLARVE